MQVIEKILSPLWAILDRASFNRRLPDEFGGRPVRVTTRSHRRYLTRGLQEMHGDLFQAITSWISARAVVYDVGANLGIFSFAAAQKTGTGGTVYAFEPDIECCGLMERSRLLRCPDEAEVVIFPVAVSDSDAVVKFEVSAYRSAASSIADFGRFDKGGATRAVPCFSLDSLVSTLSPPSLVKIDVEGAENLVLKGAERSLREYRPVLLCECTGGESAEETAALLRSAGYVWAPMTDPGSGFGDDSISTSEIVAVHREAVDTSAHASARGC